MTLPGSRACVKRIEFLARHTSICCHHCASASRSCRISLFFQAAMSARSARSTAVSASETGVMSGLVSTMRSAA